MQQNENDLLNNLSTTLFSWSTQANLQPLHIAKAKGVYLYSTEGQKILDFSSQLMNVNIGHGDERVLEAVSKQMKDFSYIYPGMISSARGELGIKLAEISPGSLNRTFFTLGGSDGIENAIKLARHYSGRSKIISRYRSYHGSSYGAISAGGDPRKLSIDSQGVPNIVHVEDPYCYRCPWSQKADSCKLECASHLERVINFEGPQNIAAILMEGESGTSGCMIYPEGYLSRVAELCKKYKILFIADEVMSGFGRTGKWFGVNHYNVIPDIMVTAKGLTSGYVPLGAITIKEKIAEYYNDTPLPLGLTYSAHPVSCAAALSVVNIYEQDDLIKKAALRGDYIQKKMQELKSKHPSIGDYRAKGLLGVIELVKNRESKNPLAPWNAKPSDMKIMNKLAAHLRKNGLFTFVRWNFIFIAPPLIISEAQINEGLEIISSAIEIADEYIE